MGDDGVGSRRTRTGGGAEERGLEGEQKDKDGSWGAEEAPTQLRPNFRTKSCKQREQGMKKKRDS